MVTSVWDNLNPSMARCIQGSECRPAMWSTNPSYNHDLGKGRLGTSKRKWFCTLFQGPDEETYWSSPVYTLRQSGWPAKHYHHRAKPDHLDFLWHQSTAHSTILRYFIPRPCYHCAVQGGTEGRFTNLVWAWSVLIWNHVSWSWLPNANKIA